MNGSAEDVEAAALLCELRASPVVHTGSLYPAPRAAISSHVRNQVRLPSPHEIFGREWNSGERRASPLAPVAKRKRDGETFEAWPNQRRHRPPDEEIDQPPPPPPHQPQRRGYLSMSALGVLEAPPPPQPRTPSDLHAPSDVRSSDARSSEPLHRPSDLRLPTEPFVFSNPQAALSPYPSSALGLGTPTGGLGLVGASTSSSRTQLSQATPVRNKRPGPSQGYFRATSALFTREPVAPKPRPEPIEIEDSPEPEERPRKQIDPPINAAIPEFRPLPGFRTRPTETSRPTSELIRPPTELLSRPSSRPAPLDLSRTMDHPIRTLADRASDSARRLPDHSSRMLADSATRPIDQVPRTPLEPVPRTPSEAIPRTPVERIIPRTPTETVVHRTPSDYGFARTFDEGLKRVWEEPRVGYDDTKRLHEDSRQAREETRRGYEDPRRAWEDTRVAYDDSRRGYETSLRTGYEPPREPRRVWEDASPVRILGGYGESSRTYGESSRPYGESSRTYVEPSRTYAEPSRPYVEAAKEYEFPPRTTLETLPRIHDLPRGLPDIQPADFTPRSLPDLAPRTPSDLPSRSLVDLPPPPRTPSELPPHTPSRALQEYPFADRPRAPSDASYASRESPEVHRFSLPRETPRELYERARAQSDTHERPRAPSDLSPDIVRDPSSVPPRTPSDGASRQSSDFTSQPGPSDLPPSIPEYASRSGSAPEFVRPVSTVGIHKPRVPQEFQTDTEPPSSPLSDENETADEDERERVRPEVVSPQMSIVEMAESLLVARQDLPVPMAVGRESPVPMVRGSPVLMRRESPVVARHESPTMIRNTSPVVARRESPVPARQSSPVAARRGSPIASKHHSPVTTRFDLPRLGSTFDRHEPLASSTRLDPIRTELPPHSPLPTPIRHQPSVPIRPDPPAIRTDFSLPMRTDPPTPRQELPLLLIDLPPPTPARSDPTLSRLEPPTPSRLEALAHVAHGDMNIYPVNAPPPAPKTTHSTAPMRKPTLIGTGKAGTKMRPKPRPEPEPESELIDTDTEQIRCKCGLTTDDRGPTVCCDGCGNWQHLRCYGVLDDAEVSRKSWMCGLCGKDKDKDRDRDMGKDGMEWERTNEVEDKDGKNGVDVEMEGASTADEKEREKDKGKEPVGTVFKVRIVVFYHDDIYMSFLQKKEPVGKSKAGTRSAPRPSSGARPNHKIPKPSATPLFSTSKPVAATIRTITAPPKKMASSSTKVSSKPLSASSARPSSSNLKARSAAGSSRPSSIDPSPRVRAKPLSPVPTPPAPRSPRASSPLAPEPVVKTVAVEHEKESPGVQTWHGTPKLKSKVVPSPVPLHTALPPSSPRPPTPPAPSPPKPSVPMNDIDDDDINAAHWATEYDHISSNIVDAALRERLRTFGREQLAKRVHSKSEAVPPLTPFTSSEPVFLPSSQQNSYVRVKEIKPPPNQHSPTYGVIATKPISKGSLVLEYRCALSDAHAYISNKAHQYALLGTGTKYVRLVPSSLDICLDARVMGNEGRFVRCGCWPNAVVRPFICAEGKDEEPEARFGVFALRGLELGEEVVLGWEWAVEHVVHKLVRDEKLGPLPEDEDILSDSDTKRLWDILDLLRSLSMTCACKPDASNCALSFGRMVLEDVDAVGHARDLGPLVGYKRHENGFEPTIHAVSSKTRRGRKSAARDRKLRQSVARPPSPPPKAPTPPRGPTPPVIKEPTPPREPTPPAAKEPTPPPARESTPPLRPISPLPKNASGKLSGASSPLSELSEVDHEAGEESPERGRPTTLVRGKRKRRIESSSPDDEAGVPVQAESPSLPQPEINGGVELVPQSAHEEVEVSLEDTQGEKSDIEVPAGLATEKTAKQLGAESSIDLTGLEGQGAGSPKAEHELNDTTEAGGSEQATQEGHDHDDAPKKMSFLDWARRRRATQPVDTKDMLPHFSHELDAHHELSTTEPPMHVSVSLELSGVPKPGPVASIEPASQSTVNYYKESPLDRPPQPEPISVPLTNGPQTSEIVSADIAMQDAPPFSAPPRAPDIAVSDANHHVQPIPEPQSLIGKSRMATPEPPGTMDVDPVVTSSDPPNSTTPRANSTSSSPAEQEKSTSPLVTPQTTPAVLPQAQSGSSPIVSSLVNKLSNTEVNPPKPPMGEELIRANNNSAPSRPHTEHSNHSSPARATRVSTDAPEEGEITAPRAPAPSHTPVNGSPSTVSQPLPPSGPRNQVPPTQPRKFPAGQASPSGSSSSVRGGPPYNRPPPSGPSRGLNVSPRAPPSAPRADRRPYNPSPPTGPRDPRDRDRERDRERERDWERDRDRDRDDRDRDARGRGRGFGPPRGPSAGPWRGSRGRGMGGRGSWR
ncbi:unnamed protein product [Rhizoctonia solani]|uniref:Uncharacterized protein n=1 Tax=Rhizoctonia solani TaxID=456999 RepID=A0A8H2ZWL6_9AGAM|nr:unnamed protein product [Rhizoctonia solani]